VRDASNPEPTVLKMKTTGEKLVYMANQIGDFFKSYPHDQAVQGIRDHIKKFWEPRMLQEVYAIIQKPDAGLRPEALEALQQLAAADAAKKTTKTTAVAG
jgi:formate dehydrogenase subunit delta